MKTGKMITHLHNQHDYRFVECSIVHMHTPACFELPESRFYYITDAKLIHKADKTPLPTTNLREVRRPAVQKTQARKIAASRTNETSPEESDSMSIAATTPSMPASVASTSSMPTASTSVPAAAAAAESANAIDTRACMADFARTYPNTAGIGKHTELLVDLDMPVSEWAGIENANLEAMDICWTPRDLVRWKSFAKKWAVVHGL